MVGNKRINLKKSYIKELINRLYKLNKLNIWTKFISKIIYLPSFIYGKLYFSTLFDQHLRAINRLNILLQSGNSYQINTTKLNQDSYNQLVTILRHHFRIPNNIKVGLLSLNAVIIDKFDANADYIT